MHVGCFESIGCLKYSVEYISIHSFSGPPYSANSTDGT
jgi:hypothetical protein